MQNKVYLMVGAPGSGKSTWGQDLARKDANLVRLCPDEFRAKFGKGEDDQSVSAAAFGATRQGMRDALTAGKDVLIDACLMYPKARKEFTSIAKEFGARTIAMVFEADKETLMERNRKRGAAGGRCVPEFVIDRMLGRYQRPTELEVDEVNFITKLDLVS